MGTMATDLKMLVELPAMPRAGASYNQSYSIVMEDAATLNSALELDLEGTGREGGRDQAGRKRLADKRETVVRALSGSCGNSVKNKKVYRSGRQVSHFRFPGKLGRPDTHETRANGEG
jgi:hypothetical protein